METARWNTGVPCKNSRITALNSVKREMAGVGGRYFKVVRE